MIEVQTKPAPVEVVTPIRPSEAIRLGCLTTGQTFDRLGGDGVACVMGAMYLGLGNWDGEDSTFGYHVMTQAARDALRDVGSLPCPLGCDPHADFGYRVGPAHMNDFHRWSRERIADWLESIGL